MKFTQTKYFSETKEMNEWLRENKIIAIDVKMTATSHCLYYLVIYEMESAK